MKWLEDFQVQLGEARMSLGQLAGATLVLVVGFLLASRISARIRGLEAVTGGKARWPSPLARFVGYAIRVGSVALALQLAGVDIGSVLAAGAVLAVGIGIAMQKVAENFVSGIILFAEQSIREGDVIEFDGRIARVQQVGIRATIALTLDEEEIIVPNSILAQSAVKNLTLTESIIRLRATVGVAYASDVNRVMSVLAQAATALEWREQSRNPVVLLIGFGSSSIDFEVSVWTRNVWGHRRDQSALRVAVWHALKENGIAIPFPQVDVHLPGGAVAESAPAGA